MRRMPTICLLVLALALALGPVHLARASKPPFLLGNEVLLTRYHHLVAGKRVGLVTNQSGVNQKGETTIDVLASDPSVTLAALYGPEHGIDGKAAAGAYVESYVHPTLDIPVYSLYGATREPTQAMLSDIDVILFDIQDVGSRTYTYISTLNYVMKAASKCGLPVVVLDRPNPLGGETIEAPVLEDAFQTFVGVDNLPMAHGMTVGELAGFFNREIGANLTVVPMEGYTRDTIYQDTGLDWVPTSPNIPDIDSVFGYMATGLGEGTGIFMGDKFKWIGGKGIDAQRFADLLNGAGLTGVTYVPEVMNGVGGVRLQITDYRTFNPARSGLYALAYARQLCGFTVPKSGSTPASVVMFDKIMGTDRVGKWLEQKLAPEVMESMYQDELLAFGKQRSQYLIYGYADVPGKIGVVVDNVPVFFDSEPYLNQDDRVMVPVRFLSQALGADVSWEEATSTVTLRKGEHVVTLVIGSVDATVSGRAELMDTAPVLVEGRTMAPVRFVSQFFGAEVIWDDAAQLVIVTQGDTR